MSKNKVMLTKRERKRQNIAIAVMFLFILPVAVMFASFFLMAFFKDGHLSLENFEFVIRPMKLRDQTTIPAIGKALRNSVIFILYVCVMKILFQPAVLLIWYIIFYHYYNGFKTEN